jgi:hypothetical protein
MVPVAFGTRTGDVPMHAIVAHRSETGACGCGQHGCGDAVGVHVIVGQLIDAETSTNNSIRAESFAIPSTILSTRPDIAIDTAR